jgi:hypothetical protein
VHSSPGGCIFRLACSGVVRVRVCGLASPVDYFVILEASWEIIQDKHVAKGGAGWKLYARMQVRIIAPAVHALGETKAWAVWGACFRERCVDPSLLE